MSKTKSKRKTGLNKELKENLTLFLVPFVLFACSILICSIIAVAADLKKTLNFPVILSVFALCSFLGAFLSGNKKRKNGIVTGIIYNLPTILVFAIASSISNSFSIDLNILFSILIMLAFSAIGGIVGVNSRLKAKRGVR